MSNIHNVGLGDHICVYYDSDEQRSSAIAEYLKLGLLKNERCLCIAEEHVLSEVVVALRAGGVDVERASGGGRLLLQPVRETHLRGGQFDAEGMLKLLDDAVEQALDDGFVGLRAVGDMSWILEGVPGTERVFEYEAMMNQFYPTSRAVGLCLYDRRLLDMATLERALHTHPMIGANGEMFLNALFDQANQHRDVSLDAASFDIAIHSMRRNTPGATPLRRGGGN